jgi:hypothetical protein
VFNQRRLNKRSASEQLQELVDSQACVGNDLSQGALPDLLVIGNDDPGLRVAAAKNHVAAALAAKDESGAL